MRGEGAINQAIKIARQPRAEGGGFHAHQPKIPHMHKMHAAKTGFKRLHIGPIHSPVAGRTDHLPMHVPSGSYVLPADVTSAHGEGNTMAAFKVLRRMFGGSPYGQGAGTYGQGNGPYGEPLQGHADGGAVDDDGVPIVAAGGEMVLSPDQVRWAGDGDLEEGHKVLDDYVKQVRANLVETLKALPGPRKD